MRVLPAAYEYAQKLFINPGAATGAFNAGFKVGEEPTPSFVLMDVQASPPRPSACHLSSLPRAAAAAPLLLLLAPRIPLYTTLHSHRRALTW